MTVLPERHSYPYEHFNLITSAFLAGHLHVAVEPRPGMLAVSNPYDPVLDGAYRNCIDCSLFQGKYYLSRATRVALPHRSR